MNPRTPRQAESPSMLKTRLLPALLAGLLLAPAVHAAGPGSLPGAAFVLGPVSHPHNPAGVYNPAAAAVPNSRHHIGLFEAGAGMELGDVDSLVDELDELQETLEDSSEFLEEFLAENAHLLADPNALMEALEDHVDDTFGGFLERAEASGYVKGASYAAHPLTPALFRIPGREDALSLEYNLGTQMRLGVLSAPVTINDGGGSNDPDDWSLESDIALHVQDADTRDLSLGYARPLMRHGGAVLLGGAKVRLIQGELNHAILPLDGLEDDVMEAAADVIGNDTRATSQIGLDLGALWVTPYWRAGATLVNINEPTLNYKALGEDCAEKAGDAQVRCEAAAGFADSVDLEPSYTYGRQLRLEGAAHTLDEAWVAAGYLEANAVEDAFGDEYQWAGVSVSSAPGSGWYPGFRMGYRTNLAGEKLSYVTTGLSFFSSVHLDIGYALDSVEFDEEDYPRSLTFNLRAGIAF